MLTGHDVANREVRANEDRARSEPREDTRGLAEGGGVDIEPQDTPGRRAPLEDRLGMASPTDGAVDVAATFAGIKLGEYFGQENRLMQPPVSIARPRGP